MLALNTSQAKTIGIAAVVAVLVIGGLVSLVISAIIGRVITVVVAIALALVVWNQRGKIETAARNCDATFFGVHLTPSDPALKAKCQQLTNR